MGRPKETHARGLAKSNDEQPATQAQPLYRVPNGYKEEVWMLAVLFRTAAKHHGQSLDYGLPVVYDVIDEATRADQGEGGWGFPVAVSFATYWRAHVAGKPSGKSFDRHWAELYPGLRDEFRHQLSASERLRLEARIKDTRAKVESGEIGIVRRIK